MDINTILALGLPLVILVIIYLFLYNRLDDDDTDNLLSPNEDDEANYLEMLSGDVEECEYDDE